MVKPVVQNLSPTNMTLPSQHPKDTNAWNDMISHEFA